IDPASIDVDFVIFRSNHWLVSHCAIDESGRRLFTDEQTEKLGAKGHAPLARAANRILQLTGFTAEAAEEIVGESVAEAEPATI
ncbi:MAG: hypothetical protein WA001_04255, partial [Patescibacteria group bacterium]